MNVPAQWLSRIAKAQVEPTIDLIDGTYQRLRYGTEPIASGLHCRDCAARTGQLHVAGCAVELCPRCGGQTIGCLTCTPPDDGDEACVTAEVVMS